MLTVGQRTCQVIFRGKQLAAAWRAVVLGALLLLGIAPAAVLAADEGFYAAKISERNLHRIPPGGMDAIGGKGDWFLTDGELCAIISSHERAIYLSLHGGVLVDLWHCDKANDQWSTAHQQNNLRKEEIPVTESISAGDDNSRAWIETRAQLAGIETSTRYSLDANHPGQLGITTTLSRVEAGPPLRMHGTVILHPGSSLTPFTLNTQSTNLSRGFFQPEVDTSSIRSILASLTTADVQVLVGSRHLQPAISYGVQTVSAEHYASNGEVRPLLEFLIGGETFSLHGLFTAPLPEWWPDEAGVLSFAVGQLMDLDAGERIVQQTNLLVGERADAASITDRLYSGTLVSGRLDTGEAGVGVFDIEDNSITYVRPDADGHFSFRLPAAITQANLRINTPWGTSHKGFTVAGATLDLGAIDTGAVGTVQLPQGQPMSLIFNNSAGTPTVFMDELTGAIGSGGYKLTGPASTRLSLSGSRRDPPSVQLAPGTYEVIASRGPEYELSIAHIDVVAGATTELALAPPPRAVDTKGQVSADLHVHSGVSFDATLTPEQRVIDFVAQGGEVLVTTEHNITYDMQAVIESLQLDDLAVAFSGVEITGMVRTPQAPTTIGHSNVFPLEADPKAHLGGTLPFEGRRLGEVIDAYKKQHPQSIFQINHPRDGDADSDIAFFNHLSFGVSFDPDKPLAHAPNASLVERLPGSDYRDVDFDAIELLTGNAMDRYHQVREDWFALLRQNMYKVATANSDSHASSQIVALPRNMLALDSAHPQEITPAALAAAVKSGNLYGTTGPLLQVRLGDTPPGGTYAGKTGTLHIEISSASWVPVEEVRIWINGELHQTLPATGTDKLEVPIEVEDDSFLFVEVVGKPSARYRQVAPGITPFAFANPIFIDSEGRGWRFRDRN